MILSFPTLCVKSALSPLNQAIHPGIQSFNYRCLRSLGGSRQGMPWGVQARNSFWALE
jgi:hypothetical protein